MKKLFFVIVNLFLFTSIQAKNENDSLYIPHKEVDVFNKYRYFCDACGCAAGNGSSGFESLLNPQFIGVKYFSQHYRAKENLFTDKLTQDQYFNTIQIWGKIPVTEKLSVYGSIPYHFHNKKTMQEDIRIDGIGDINVMGIYKFLNSKDAAHKLNGGIGIKVPVGKFDEKGITGTNPSFQLGTRSWDYQMVLNYRYQKNNIAVLLNTDYIIKTENKKHYQFGNQWNYSATGFYRLWQNENSVISGKLGLQGEVYDWNKQFDEIMPGTSGSALYGRFGFETSYKKFSLGSEVMLPTYTNLASGDIEAEFRFSVFLNFGL